MAVGITMMSVFSRTNSAAISAKRSFAQPLHESHPSNYSNLKERLRPKKPMVGRASPPAARAP